MVNVTFPMDSGIRQLPWCGHLGLPATLSLVFFLLTISAATVVGSNSSLRLQGETQDPSTSVDALFLLILTSFHIA